MTTEFIDAKIWSRLRRLARKCRRPASIAVAYFSKGAAKNLLPLRKGSRLVVDASEATVKSGLTCPSDLLELQAKGVRVYSVQNLHAKVYIFGGQAFIGSSNASQFSAYRLKEAMLRTTERGAVKAARAFVRDLCKEELGPEALKGLQKLYRRPKLPIGQKQRRPRDSRNVQAKYSGLRLVSLELCAYPEGSESANEQGRREAEARRRHRKTHELEEFRWHDNSIKKNEAIIQVVDVHDGRSSLVSPPGIVTNTKKWSNGRQSCTFVYLEVLNRRCTRLNKLAKRLGRGAAKRLKRSGRVASDFANKLRDVWSR